MSTGQKPSQIDPEIADLMGISQGQADPAPAFSDLFHGEKAANAAAGTKEADKVDLSKMGFTPIQQLQEKPKPFFTDKDYYKKVLTGEGEIAKKVHGLFTQFMNAKDPQEKSTYRARLISAYWELGAGMITRIGRKLPLSKLLMLRFGVLLPTLLNPEQRLMMSSIIMKNNTGEPVHYLDEWILKIAQGAVNPSATDEVKQLKRNEDQKLLDRIEKKRGQREAELSLLRNKIVQLEESEQNLLHQTQCILGHQTRSDYDGLKDAYTQDQREAITNIGDTLRRLSNLDREIKGSYSQLTAMDQELRELQERAGSGDLNTTVDRGMVLGEFNSVRQMSKLCVGRQGNHFPILMKHYIHSNIRELGTRENVINEMARVEKLDSGLFHRTFKGQTNRIVPHVLLLPNYGENGICWEPFERFNRASSRGRIAIPLYPKDLKTAVIAALADLRWQVAKEKAQHYWMEEGITGRYYQWFEAQKLKGDVRDYFIRDYILWINKESQGTQKLDREVRGIFWRLMPFPQDIKDTLRNRGFVYHELYKKDTNIARSDGY